MRRTRILLVTAALAHGCAAKGGDSSAGAGAGGDEAGGGSGAEDEDDGGGDGGGDTAAAVVEDCATPGDEDGDGVADCADADCLADPACACVDADLGARASLSLVDGTNRSQGDDWTSTCAAEAGAEDVEFSWAPPSSGCWQFSIEGADMAPVLTAVRGTCGGAEFGCVDADEAAAGSLTLNLDEAESVVLVVDGASAADAGSFVLGVQAVDALDWEPAIILGAETGPALHSGPNTTSLVTATPSCADGTTAMVIAWLAPADGAYRFDTSGSAIDTALEVFTHCGRPLGCAADGAAGVEATLLKGESIKLAIWGVGGATGEVTVNVTALQ